MKKREVDHSLLDKAKINKKDEFYTQLIDIEKEVVHYTKHFRGKVVYYMEQKQRLMKMENE